MKPLASALLLSILILGTTGRAEAQSVICLVEPMPELPGGGGMQAIVAAIQKRVTYPQKALQVGARGRVFVGFTVTPGGWVKNEVIVKSFRRDCGLAVVSAVRRLPRFEPRLQKYGDVQYTVPVTFDIEGTGPPLKPLQRGYQQALQKAR